MLPRITKIKKKMNTGNKCRSLSEEINIGNPINSYKITVSVSQLSVCPVNHKIEMKLEAVGREIKQQK